MARGVVKRALGVIARTLTRSGSFDISEAQKEQFARENLFIWPSLTCIENGWWFVSQVDKQVPVGPSVCLYTDYWSQVAAHRPTQAIYRLLRREYLQSILERRTGEERQAELPLPPPDEAEELRTQLIEERRTVQALHEQNERLTTQVTQLRNTQEDLLARISSYQEALENARAASRQQEAGHLLISERFRGRVASCAESAFDVVYDDGQGQTFVQTYETQQLRGARIPVEGDWVYAYATVFRVPAGPIDFAQIFQTQEQDEELDLRPEPLEGTSQL